SARPPRRRGGRQGSATAPTRARGTGGGGRAQSATPRRRLQRQGPGQGQERTAAVGGLEGAWGGRVEAVKARDGEAGGDRVGLLPRRPAQGSVLQLPQGRGERGVVGGQEGGQRRLESEEAAGAGRVDALGSQGGDVDGAGDTEARQDPVDAARA